MKLATRMSCEALNMPNVSVAAGTFGRQAAKAKASANRLHFGGGGNARAYRRASVIHG
jgi:hypothetical protein